jgi:hypothetical protein
MTAWHCDKFDNMYHSRSKSTVSNRCPGMFLPFFIHLRLLYAVLGDWGSVKLAQSLALRRMHLIFYFWIVSYYEDVHTATYGTPQGSNCACNRAITDDHTQKRWGVQHLWHASQQVHIYHGTNPMDRQQLSWLALAGQGVSIGHYSAWQFLDRFWKTVHWMVFKPSTRPVHVWSSRQLSAQL